MHRVLINSTMAALGMIAAGCLVSLMAVFMGGGQEGSDLHALLIMQLVTVPAALLITVFVIMQYAKKYGMAGAFRSLWRDVPQWLVFIFLLLNSLSLAGEVALLIALNAFGDAVTWKQHVPLLCLLSSTLAICALYARYKTWQDGRPAFSGRWPR